MSRYFEQLSNSPRAQLVVTAVVSSIVTVSFVLGVQNADKLRRVAWLKSSITDEEQRDPIADDISKYKTHHSNNHVDVAHRFSYDDDEDDAGTKLANRARHGHYDEELILEQLARNRVFLTDQGLKTLRGAFVIVVGLGGVGSHATAALARSGVGRLRLIDFDQVTLSSLNRHALATLADVGSPKVHCVRKRLEQIVPWVHFDCRNELFGNFTAKEQLASWAGQKPDFVIDAIDNIDSKVELLKLCHESGLKVVSSMGAGCKSDPTRVLIGDISASTEDALSRSTRRRLRLAGVSQGIPVVFSTEKPGPGKASLLPLPEEEYRRGQVGDLGVLPDFRVRILPVLGTMPAVFGLAVANHVILDITGYPHDYITGKAREKMYEGVLAALQASEEKLVRVSGADALGLRVPISVAEVGYLVDDVFRGKSVVSGLTSRLCLARWARPPAPLPLSVEADKHLPLKLEDLVVMTRDEITRHEKEVLSGKQKPADLYGPNVVALVQQRHAEVRHNEQWR